MAKVMTAISIDKELFRAVEERAGKMSIARSEFYSRAVANLARDEETWEMLARPNEPHTEEPDKGINLVLELGNVPAYEKRRGRSSSAEKSLSELSTLRAAGSPDLR